MKTLLKQLTFLPIMAVCFTGPNLSWGMDTLQGLSQGCQFEGQSKLSAGVIKSLRANPSQYLTDSCVLIQMFAKALTEKIQLPAECAPLDAIHTRRSDFYAKTWAYLSFLPQMRADSTQIAMANNLERVLSMYIVQGEQYFDQVGLYPKYCADALSPNGTSEDVLRWSLSKDLMLSLATNGITATWDKSGVKMAIDSSYPSVATALGI